MFYYSYNDYLRKRFNAKVRRIGLNAGFVCPTGGAGSASGGCLFCNESAFSQFPGGNIPSLKEQITRSMDSFRKRRGTEKFIAYFQNASGTNAPLKKLKAAYDVIRDFPEIVSLVISTRPDCVDDEKLDLIASYVSDYDVWVEYGLQTIHDRTLKAIGRGHTFADSADAINRTSRKGIKAAAHVILGLGGESRQDMIATAREISRLPLSGIKLHVLHVLRGTSLERLYKKGKILIMQRSEYIDAACDFMENLRSDCVMIRLVSDSRREFLVAPEWMNDKLSVIRGIGKEFKSRGTRQGSAFT